MIFSPNATLDLFHERLPVPFAALLAELMRVEFDRDACQRVIDAALAEGLLEERWLRHRTVRDDELLFSDDVLFPSVGDAWQLVIERRGGPSGDLAGAWAFGVDAGELPRLTALIRDGATGADPAAFRAEYDELPGEVLDALLAGGGASGSWAPRRSPGIYRLEHASLLVCSATTALLVDPLTSLNGLPGLEASPSRLGQGIDAVLVTHGHGDHFHVPSLLARLDSLDTPVLVPEVPRPSVLTPWSFAPDLQALGCRAARTVAWGETIRVGDIEIDVLPFYGEQPTREHPGAQPGLRNWGNCFRFQTPELSVTVLVDSGRDPAGAMTTVLHELRARRGECDLLLACLREFDSPFFGGLENYWAALPLGRLRELRRRQRAGQLPSTTAGPRGIAEACAAAGARFAAGYAHGFSGVGVPIGDIGWGLQEPSEAEASVRLRRALAEVDGVTEVLEWRCGEGLHAAAGGAIRCSEPAESR